MNFFQNEAGRHNGKGQFDNNRHGVEDNIKRNTREIIPCLNESRQTDLDVTWHKCLATYFAAGRRHGNGKAKEGNALHLRLPRGDISNRSEAAGSFIVCDRESSHRLILL